MFTFLTTFCGTGRVPVVSLPLLASPSQSDEDSEEPADDAVRTKQAVRRGAKRVLMLM